jgi:hypothetical protein
MLIGRFIFVIPPLAVAGSLAQKKAASAVGWYAPCQSAGVCWSSPNCALLEFQEEIYRFAPPRGHATRRRTVVCVKVQQIGHSDGYRMRASRFSRVIFAIRTSTLALPKAPESWSLTSLREKLNKIGARVVSHGRYVTFQMAEVAVSRQMFAKTRC